MSSDGFELRHTQLEGCTAKIQDGTHFSPQSDAGPYRYITSKNIRFGRMDLEDCGWISDSEHRAIFQRCDVRFGDVLLTKDGANTGNACINALDEEFSLLSSVALIRCDETRCHSRYLLQFILSEEGQQRIKDLMAGNAITRLTLEKIRAFVVPLPPLPEQRKIALILDALDQAIERTEALIAKLKQIKAGLLHDLLTRGLDENGELRDPQKDPGDFKDSPSGRIPKGWEVKKIDTIAENLDNLRIPVNADERFRRGGTVPYYGANGIQGFIDRPLFDEPLILLAEDGGNFDEYAERPIAYRILGPSWVNNHAHILRPKSDVGFGFLFFSLEHRDIRKYIRGGTRSKLNQSELNNVEVAMPKPTEQERISSILEGHETEADCKVTELAKLRELKNGLMSDLLTGKIRVAIKGEDDDR